jgi:PEP-CTERM motif
MGNLSLKLTDWNPATAKYYMKQALSLKKFALLAGAILLSIQVARAQTTPIYRELFANTTGVNASPSIDSWSGAWSATAIDSQGTGGGAVAGYFGFSSSTGNSLGSAGINTTPAEPATGPGFLFVSGGAGHPGATSWIATTSAYTIDTSAYAIQDISFYSGNNFTTSLEHFVVQIDGNWYASTQTFGNSAAVSSAGNFAAQAQLDTFTWTTAASAWETLNYTPGTTLTVGSVLTSPLSGDNITAFGLYSDGTGVSSTIRADTFEIDATPVPEPGSLALAALSGFGMMIGLRRSRKA